MKHYFLSLLVLLVLIGCSKPINHDQLLTRSDGLIYELASSKPYTGRSTEYKPLHAGSEWGYPWRCSRYKRGLLHGKQTTYHRGNSHNVVQEELYWKRGKIQGKERVYYQSGQLEAVLNWKDNELHGKVITYHENGQVRTKGHHVNGEKSGKWIVYNANGYAVKRPYFVDGEEVRTWSPLFPARKNRNPIHGTDYKVTSTQIQGLTFSYWIEWHTNPSWVELAEKLVIDLSLNPRYLGDMVEVKLYHLTDGAYYADLKARKYARDGNLVGN
jgi:hypothetical protein